MKCTANIWFKDALSSIKIYKYIKEKSCNEMWCWTSFIRNAFFFYLLGILFSFRFWRNGAKKWITFWSIFCSFLRWIKMVDTNDSKLKWSLKISLSSLYLAKEWIYFGRTLLFCFSKMNWNLHFQRLNYSLIINLDDFLRTKLFIWNRALTVSAKETEKGSFECLA